MFLLYLTIVISWPKQTIYPFRTPALASLSNGLWRPPSNDSSASTFHSPPEVTTVIRFWWSLLDYFLQTLMGSCLIGRPCLSDTFEYVWPSWFSSSTERTIGKVGLGITAQDKVDRPSRAKPYSQERMCSSQAVSRVLDSRLWPGPGWHGPPLKHSPATLRPGSDFLTGGAWQGRPQIFKPIQKEIAKGSEGGEAFFSWNSLRKLLRSTPFISI